FICSPNNPTANQFRLEDVKGLIEGFDWLVVLDETYVDFATYSMVDLTREYENLVVLRTFSKVFGIAGLRLGYAVSNVDVSSALRERFQMPYPVSSVTLRMGLKLLRNLDLIKEKIESLKEERATLIRRLSEMEGVKPFNSETNFVLMNLTEMSSDEAYRRLLDQGIIVRNIGRVLNLENCIRVTVAPRPMMERFLETFRRIIGR
ncbi:histidinol-phosphate transaminase, partial [Candidatus Bathyarchaeota archaeon ex4484_40]